MTRCERCGRKSYITYITEWGIICDKCEDRRRSQKKS